MRTAGEALGADDPFRISPVEGGRLHLNIMSDTICPWCYVGKRHLAAVLLDLVGDSTRA